MPTFSPPLQRRIHEGRTGSVKAAVTLEACKNQYGEHWWSRGSGTAAIVSSRREEATCRKPTFAMIGPIDVCKDVCCPMLTRDLTSQVPAGGAGICLGPVRKDDHLCPSSGAEGCTLLMDGAVMPLAERLVCRSRSEMPALEHCGIPCVTY